MTPRGQWRPTPHDWVEEQIRFGQLRRASTAPATRELPMSYLGERARLTPDHLRRAADWNTRNERPHVTLPGGRIRPTGPHRAAPPGRYAKCLYDPRPSCGTPAAPSHEYLCGLLLISAIKSSTISS